MHISQVNPVVRDAIAFMFGAACAACCVFAALTHPAWLIGAFLSWYFGKLIETPGP